MPAPKNRRWQCPSGEHPGALAPGRLRKDDIRRFCWPCSQAAGVLVERVCPSLDKQREERERVRRKKTKRRKAAAKKATQTRRARQAERRTVSLGDQEVNLLDEAERLWALPAMRAARLANHTPASLPIINLRSSMRLTVSEGARGRAWDGWVRGRVSITVGAARNAVAALEVLLHELVHVAVGCSHGHDNVFRRTLVEAAEQAWGVASKVDMHRRRYGTDWRLEIAMVDALREGRFKLGRKKIRVENDMLNSWAAVRVEWLKKEKR